MIIREFFEGSNKQLSFMRLALTPSILSCCFGIVYGAIKQDAAVITASGVTLTGLLFSKAHQSRFEKEVEDATNR